MKKTLLAIAALAIISVSCKKEETTTGGGGGTPAEQILWIWHGDDQIMTIDVSGTGGVADTNFTEITPIPWLNLKFNADGTGSSDSAGFDTESLTWVIKNNGVLVLDGTDTVMIRTLNSTNLNLGQAFIDDSNAPMIIDYDFELTFKR